jgi:hypothetical protein
VRSAVIGPLPSGSRSFAEPERGGVGGEPASGVEPRHHDLLALGRVVDVLLAGEPAVAGVGEHRDAGEPVLGVATGGVREDLPRQVHDPIAVDDGPLHRELHHRHRSHELGDLGPDGLAADDRAVVVLDPDAVLGVQVGPAVPVARVAGGEDLGERGFDLGAWMARGHGRLPSIAGVTVGS